MTPATCPDCDETGRCAPTCHQLTDSAPLLGQDAAEAQRIAVGGRPIRLLKESREFDAERLETTGLFAPAKRQQQLF